jgi:YVTN family beta-propeller protein
MTSFRAAILAALCSIFLASCGDTFRPIAIPETGPLPTPQVSKTAEVITDSGTPTGLVTNYNLSGGTITGQAPLGQGPSSALLLGSRTYVANQADNTLSVFSALSPQSPVPGTVTLTPNAGPQALAVGPNLAVLYVAYPALDSIGIVSTSSNTEIGTIQLSAQSGPSVMITNSTGTKLFVGNTGSNGNNISVIDIASSAVVATIGGCSHPIAMARTPDVPYIYVACRDSNNVLVVNANTNVADYDFPVGAQPVSATFDLVRKRLMVTSMGSNTVTFFEENFSLPLASQHVQTIVPVAGSPISAAPLPDGSRVYVGTSNGLVVVIDDGNLTVRTNIPVSGQGLFIAPSTDSTRVAVATGAPNALNVIDTTTDTLITTHSLAGGAKALIIF